MLFLYSFIFNVIHCLKTNSVPQNYFTSCIHYGNGTTLHCDFEEFMLSCINYSKTQLQCKIAIHYCLPGFNVTSHCNISINTSERPINSFRNCPFIYRMQISHFISLPKILFLTLFVLLHCSFNIFNAQWSNEVEVFPRIQTNKLLLKHLVYPQVTSDIINNIAVLMPRIEGC